MHSKESEHESTCLLVNDTVPCGGCCVAVILYCMQCDTQSDCYFLTLLVPGGGRNRVIGSTTTKTDLRQTTSRREGIHWQFLQRRTEGRHTLKGNNCDFVDRQVE